jgi:GTP-binding protein
MTKVPVVAILGRTNVGKSTLFNAIVGKRLSIVEDSPGVTRDRRYILVEKHDVPFTLVDTGGVIGDEDQELEGLIRHQAEVALHESDLIIAVFDGLEGVSPLDREVVELLRLSGKPVLWVVNKCEKEATQNSSADFFELGCDSVITISAAHKIGMRELMETLSKTLKELGASSATLPEVDVSGVIKVAFVGKPNVGKSTILNKLLGEERFVVSEVAGTTRDSVDINLIRDGVEYRVVDTAGLRKKANVDEATVERFSNLRTLRALAQCDVAVLVLDASEGAPSDQDAKIAALVHERGKGLVIVVNKWDTIEKDHRTVTEFTHAVYGSLKFAQYAPIVFVSAISGRRCPSILKTVKEVYDATLQRIQTSDLNKTLLRAFNKKSPPVYRGAPLKFYFSTQVSVAPPRIILFVNHPEKVHFTYQRYLKNFIREVYPFPGIDIKLEFKKKRESMEEQTEGKTLDERSHGE